MSLQNIDGNTQSLVKIVTAVTGKLVKDIKISLTAKLPINIVRTDNDTWTYKVFLAWSLL